MVGLPLVQLTDSLGSVWKGVLWGGRPSRLDLAPSHGLQLVNISRSGPKRFKVLDNHVFTPRLSYVMFQRVERSKYRSSANCRLPFATFALPDQARRLPVIKTTIPPLLQNVSTLFKISSTFNFASHRLSSVPRSGHPEVNGQRPPIPPKVHLLDGATNSTDGLS
ncbi:hypothetical protein M407DRAFT_177951 [Tulasnella calospora MUT 4182]|uniref:Uncharacterized protein n=2 Tax=Tulasnella calospora MUT 4182 TaxID=1051891 RepID=A0A0C3QVU2_9AGAM|nr:hypothetical protein M407DRAFT_177951 [Tulasnella calospora MUT 4182]